MRHLSLMADQSDAAAPATRPAVAVSILAAAASTISATRSSTCSDDTDASDSDVAFFRSAKVSARSSAIISEAITSRRESPTWPTAVTSSLTRRSTYSPSWARCEVRVGRWPGRRAQPCFPGTSLTSWVEPKSRGASRPATSTTPTATHWARHQRAPENSQQTRMRRAWTGRPS